MAADTDYDKPAPQLSNAPAIRALFARAGTSLALVAPGADFPAHCCATILNRDDLWPLGTDQSTQRDLLLLLPVEAGQPISGFRATIAGEAGLKVAQGMPVLQTHTYENDTGPAAGDGHHVVSGWVARVPVTLDPTRPWDIGGDRYPINATASYEAGGAPLHFSARAAIVAEVGSAIYEMGLAASLLPLLCLGAALLRWRRTR